jgi:hypothetical protein
VKIIIAMVALGGIGLGILVWRAVAQMLVEDYQDRLDNGLETTKDRR